MSFGQLERFLRRKARELLADLVRQSTCGFQERSLASVTPKYFPVLTKASWCPWML
ncbi:hypothetical protein DPMN_013564 [Dreissena polymorpha]|uniref:Uncharacterized protein n=1 Tax=Dreissena polymorpha TaxID=45954 RepID=A0A9D4N4G9_DREPO|nr:hypothetical protein DPMN_013553 [Dreissena polymorpha]KAH3889507.1 hypothetical protein DPMN_013564 [Dreissena polymorpha]